MPANNANARTLKRSFKHISFWNIAMTRPFQASRQLKWWEVLQYRFGGVEWFK